MTMFGLDAGHVRALVAAVSCEDDLDDEEVSRRFARAAWSVITEPGDGAAGAMLAERGASDALRLVLGEADRGGPRTVGDGRADRSALERWRPRLRSGDVERALALAARAGARMLVPAGKGGSSPGTGGAGPWPAGADDLGVHAPVVLWVRGNPALVAGESSGVALVGARAATGYGEHVAGVLSAGLVERGYAIVSGAAYGIDGAAHRVALASGGLTLAFLAGGVDRFYPAGHDELLRRVVQQGVVLSELPCGAAPTKWRFLQRNRLIAACSSATVVVEAGARSGSLNTAGHAAALGRPLGAVPGAVTSPASAGCHRLLREYDAICVTDAAQVAELAGPPARCGHDREEQAADAHEGVRGAPRDSAEVTRVLDALSTRSARTPADIAARAGLSLGVVLGVLGILDMDGRAGEVAEGWRAVPRRR
jgi:DNA processing protein